MSCAVLRALAACLFWVSEGSLQSSFSKATQTPFQKQLVDGWRTKAAAASNEATPALLTVLDSSEVREGLARCCPEIADASAIALASRLRDLVRYSELTHNFHHLNNRSTFEQDMDLTHLSDARIFYNLWQVGSLGYVANKPRGIEDYAETHLVGCREFTGGSQGKWLPASFAEASERPLYTAVNTLRIGLSAAMFGDVSIVVDKDHVRDASLFFPVDTGNWAATCANFSTPPPPNASEYPMPLNCSAWDKTLGTEEHLDHILLGMHRMRASSHNRLANPFVTIFERVVSPAVLQSYHMLAFPEVQVLGSVLWPNGVKFVLASLPSLFGSTWGDALQELCRKHRLALVWALGFNGPSDDFDWPLSTGFVDQLRLLDPLVWESAALGRNVTVDDHTRQVWQRAWSDAAQARTKGQQPFGKHWQGVWDDLLQNLSGNVVLQGSLLPEDCADSHHCVGINKKGSCICYGSKQLAQETILA